MVDHWAEWWASRWAAWKVSPTVGTRVPLWAGRKAVQRAYQRVG